MAWLIRPLRHLRQCPQLQRHHRCCSKTPLGQFLYTTPLPRAVLFSKTPSKYCFSFTTSTPSHLSARNRPGGIRSPNAQSLDYPQETETSDSESDVKKTRNQKKREARRAVRWGTDLAFFSTSQIKKILRAASLEQDVFDALMLVKRLGPDVREGKRRQFNYIDEKRKLLRETEPQLMDTLIQATKVGDQKTLQALAGPKTAVLEEVEEDDEENDQFEYSVIKGHLSSQKYANRWFDGLISKDIDITNEVYSVNSVDFDRQELRKLVRKVQTSQEQSQTVTDEDKAKAEAAVIRAKKSLTRFLCNLAKQLPVE